MSASSFFVSAASVRYLKQSAQRHVTGVSSAHLSEALAAALGFNTHAALRAALADRPTASAQKPSNARLVRRLRQLGYERVPDDLRPLPELDRSYSPFKSYPLRKKHGVRWSAWRNLMVAAINAGLEQRLFGLSAGEDWWPGADPKNNRGLVGHYRLVFDGDLPAVASVNAAGGDELAINVLLAPRDPSIEADRCHGIEDGMAVAHGWLERRLGAWIMDGGEDFACKRAVQSRVADANIEPMGYADQGIFIL